MNSHPQSIPGSPGMSCRLTGGPTETQAPRGPELCSPLHHWAPIRWPFGSLQDKAEITLLSSLQMQLYILQTHKCDVIPLQLLLQGWHLCLFLHPNPPQLVPDRDSSAEGFSGSVLQRTANSRVRRAAHVQETHANIQSREILGGDKMLSSTQTVFF